jgi:uncharacterized glyoxalase superfamily protein PhnB
MNIPGSDGEGDVSPCLLVDSIEEELHFLEVVFGAHITRGKSSSRRSMWAAEARLGNTVILIGRRPDDAAAPSGTLYVRTPDVKATFARAMSAGASPIGELTENAEGQREAGFRDPQGNAWWIGQEGKRPSNQEVARRIAEQRRRRL